MPPDTQLPGLLSPPLRVTIILVIFLLVATSNSMLGFDPLNSPLKYGPNINDIEWLLYLVEYRKDPHPSRHRNALLWKI